MANSRQGRAQADKLNWFLRMIEDAEAPVPGPLMATEHEVDPTVLKPMEALFPLPRHLRADEDAMCDALRVKRWVSVLILLRYLLVRWLQWGLMSRREGSAGRVDPGEGRVIVI